MSFTSFLPTSRLHASYLHPAAMTWQCLSVSPLWTGHVHLWMTVHAWMPFYSSYLSGVLLFSHGDTGPRPQETLHVRALSISADIYTLFNRVFYFILKGSRHKEVWKMGSSAVREKQVLRAKDQPMQLICTIRKTDRKKRYIDMTDHSRLVITEVASPCNMR